MGMAIKRGRIEVGVDAKKGNLKGKRVRERMCIYLY